MMDIERKRDLILHNKNLFKSIVILAIPIFLSNFLKSMHSFIDMIFVSPLGDETIAATAITSPIISISYALGTGFMIAGVAIMSQALGGNEVKKARKTAGQLLLLSVVCGAVFNLLLYVLAPWIVSSVGAVGKTYTLAVTYVRVRSFELIPVFMFYTFLATRQASGDTMTPVIFDIIAIALNALLTWLFVARLQMGLRGAAIGTVIGNLAIMPIFIWMLFKDKKTEISITLEDLKFSKSLVSQIVRIGVPSAITSAFTSLGFVLVNAAVLSYGDEVLSGFGIGNIINSFILMPALGVGGSVTTFVGQNIGANNPERAKASVRSAMILTLAIMIVGGAALMPFRSALAGIFLKPGTQSFLIACEYLIFLFISLPLMAIYQVFVGSFQGAGYTKTTLFLAIVRLWGLRIPLIYLFRDVFKLDPTSIMYAMVISNVGAAFLGVILYQFIHFDRKLDIKME